MTGSGGRSSIPETAVLEPRGRRVLDARFRGHDSGETCESIPAAPFARVVHRFSPSFETEGAGKAGWPLHPGPPRKKIARAREDHRYRQDQPGLPCAVVYGLLRALLGEPACCHRHRRDAQGIVANLAPAWARQDHTISPSANDAARRSAHSRPPHPRLTFRDDRDTPLCKRGGMSEPYI